MFVFVLGLCLLKILLGKVAFVKHYLYVQHPFLFTLHIHDFVETEKISHDVCWVFPVSALHRDGTNPYQSNI